MTIFNSEDFWPQRPWVGWTSALGRCSQHFEISDALGILKKEKSRFIFVIYIRGTNFIRARKAQILRDVLKSQNGPSLMKRKISLSTSRNTCEVYLSEWSPNTIHSSVSSTNDDDVQVSGIKGRQVVVTYNNSKQDWSHSEALSQDKLSGWLLLKYYKMQVPRANVLDFRNIQVHYSHQKVWRLFWEVTRYTRIVHGLQLVILHS